MDQILAKNARMNRILIRKGKRQIIDSGQERSRKQSRSPLGDISNDCRSYESTSTIPSYMPINKNHIINCDSTRKFHFGPDEHSISSLRAGKHLIKNGRIIPCNVDEQISRVGDFIHNNIDEQISRGSDFIDNNIQNVSNTSGYWDIGDPTCICEYCGAMLWLEERARRDRISNPKFSLCCMQGKVQLPKLKDPPRILLKLLRNGDGESKDFLDCIRAYNMMFSFTSMGGKVDSSINKGRGPYVFRLHGQNYHKIGSLLPKTGCSPKFSQLYIYDTENEVYNRMNSFSSSDKNNSLDAEIVDDLKSMLDEYNPLVKAFRVARDRFSSNDQEAIKLKLIGRRETDGRTYNLPTSSEVAALIVGDIGNSTEERDIIIETQDGQLKRISELHPSYLALQYPLLFPYGEDGYRIGIKLRDDTSTTSSRKRSKLSMREFFAFRIQEREGEAPTILWSRKLFQQFCVDAYTMIESERLCYVRTHQKNLRVDSYKNLTQFRTTNNLNSSTIGKYVVLPSSFTGCARYMIQNYQDAMAICKWYGYPDLFITFTCNPKWPEVMRFVQQRGLKPEDRPDILCRIFKIKLDHMIRDLKENKVFGGVRAVIYTIEFQKRGLPHAHILLFLNQEDKFPNADDIDKSSLQKYRVRKHTLNCIN